MFLKPGRLTGAAVASFRFAFSMYPDLTWTRSSRVAVRAPQCWPETPIGAGAAASAPDKTLGRRKRWGKVRGDCKIQDHNS